MLEIRSTNHSRREAEPGTSCSACSELRQESRSSLSTCCTLMECTEGAHSLQHAQKRLLKRGWISGESCTPSDAKQVCGTIGSKAWVMEKKSPLLLSDTAASCPRQQLGGLPQPTNAGGFLSPDQKLLLWEEASPAVPGDEERPLFPSSRKPFHWFMIHGYGSVEAGTCM